MIRFNYKKLSKIVIAFIIGVVLLLNTFYINEVNGIILEKTPGSLAPKFTVQDVFTNESISLSDYYGKVVMLDLFATWCQPCISAMPFIYSILFSYDPSDLIIISIDVDSRESLQLIKSFAVENNMAWYVAMDNESIVDSNYGTGFIPSMYIINQTGFIHYQEIGFNYDEVVSSLDQLISPDSVLPILSGVQVIPSSTTFSMTDNKITVICQNITDNFGVDSVFAEITSIPNGKTQQYPLSLNNNGTINDKIELDPILLYQETSIKIQICAKDYRGNMARSSEETFSIEVGPVDENPPEILSINISFTLSDNYYYFDIEIGIIDDVLVYKIELKLQEGSKQMFYKATYKRGEISSNPNRLIWADPSNLDLFRGRFKISAIDITEPENMHVTVTAEDIIGRVTIFSPKNGTNTSSTSWNNNYLLFAFVLMVFMAYRRRNR